MSDAQWVIRTNGSLFWRPAGNGYTTKLYEAGLFTEAEAKRKGRRSQLKGDNCRDEALPLSAFAEDISAMRQWVSERTGR